MPTHPALPKQFTAIVAPECDGFVALCPELDVASQGDTIEEARRNLQAAIALFLETADPVWLKLCRSFTSTPPHSEP